LLKLILAVVIFISFLIVFGVIGQLVKNKRAINPPSVLQTIKNIEISSDKKSILNVETKKLFLRLVRRINIFTRRDMNIIPMLFLNNISETTNAKYGGDCFLDASLSNNKDRIIFSTDCLEGDLQQAWVGVYDMSRPCSINADGDWTCLHVVNLKFNFLIGGSGKNFIWSTNDKTITYEADFRLDFTDNRTIDSQTGEILENQRTYKNEKYGFELKYPANLLSFSSKGPNTSQKDIDVGKEISGTAQPSYETLEFRDLSGKKKFEIGVFS